MQLQIFTFVYKSLISVMLYNIHNEWARLQIL